MICLVIEKSSLNLSALIVYKLYIEQCSFTSRIFPDLFGVLFGHSGLYFPVEKKSIQRFDGCIALIVFLLTIFPLIASFRIYVTIFRISINCLKSFLFCGKVIAFNWV